MMFRDPRSSLLTLALKTTLVRLDRGFWPIWANCALQTSRTVPTGTLAGPYIVWQSAAKDTGSIMAIMMDLDAALLEDWAASCS